MSGHKVSTSWAGTEAITKRIRGGEVVDIVLIAAPNIEKLIAEGNVHYLGPLPADIQHTTVFSAGLHTAVPAPDAARALTKFLTAPEAAAVIKRSGMEPG